MGSDCSLCVDCHNHDVCNEDNKVTRPDIFTLVHADLNARNEKGRETYGGTLRPFDGRDSHRDPYEELLDAVVYERKRKVERAKTLLCMEEIEATFMFDSRESDRVLLAGWLDEIRTALGEP